MVDGGLLHQLREVDCLGEVKIAIVAARSIC